MPAEWRARAEGAIRDRLLRVPSGRLHACGAEYLGPEPEGDPIEIPPGDYVVEVFELAWNGDDDAEIARRIREAHGWLAGIDTITSVTIGCVAVAALFGLVPLVVAALANERPGIRDIVGAILGFGVFIFASALLAYRTPALRAVRETRARLEREFPGAVIALRRAGAERPSRGALFGEGYRSELPSPGKAE